MGNLCIFADVIFFNIQSREDAFLNIVLFDDNRMLEQNFRNLVVLVGTDDVIDAIYLIDETGSQMFRHAACDNEFDPWSALLVEFHLGNSCLGAFFRFFAYGACVEKEKIGFVWIFGWFATVFFEHGSDECGIVLIHLTAVSVD